MYIYTHTCIHTYTYSHIYGCRAVGARGGPRRDLARVGMTQPEPERYLFAVGSRVGYPVFLFFVYMIVFNILCVLLCTRQ